MVALLGISSSANFAKQKLSIATVNVKEAGYIFTYLSYEDSSANYVYFDDFKVTLTTSKILQSNEYYPFGLQTAGSWTRDNTTNNFLYDAGNELNGTSGFYDLPFRNYDASLGRFFQVDLLSYRAHDLTPYQYAGNHPIVSNDPSGLVELQGYSPDEGSWYWLQNHQWLPDEGAGGSGEGFSNFTDDANASYAICPTCPGGAERPSDLTLCPTCPQRGDLNYDPYLQRFIDD